MKTPQLIVVISLALSFLCIGSIVYLFVTGALNQTPQSDEVNTEIKALIAEVAAVHNDSTELLFDNIKETLMKEVRYNDRSDSELREDIDILEGKIDNLKKANANLRFKLDCCVNKDNPKCN